MIVVDASAVIAMRFGEESFAALSARLAADADRAMSVASYLEAGTVLAGRWRSDRLKAIDDLEAFLAAAGIEIAVTDATQGRLALRARIRYGRGIGHGDALNFGDAFSDALAKALGAPLLFVGTDFAGADVRRALAPQ
jgi:ribonuclease VapC